MSKLIMGFRLPALGGSFLHRDDKSITSLSGQVFESQEAHIDLLSTTHKIRRLRT